MHNATMTLSNPQNMHIFRLEFLPRKSGWAMECVVQGGDGITEMSSKCNVEIECLYKRQENKGFLKFRLNVKKS